ncbi:sigma-54-dependent Fis family transcriptional regulator [Bacillus sp. V3-13]|uniref:sigma-54 interaction domain-containing protein n=1 Tax=Bacillus sp. V3-13 TaxID=2053728 RepID=UPI000C78487E|nr:sigma 54-interacting transcriptional regulator [Bacillus sp. V3-13]PLR77266.1 sigma-54-dependent Fis family transcriptional regulator [Bacillus sp. V3-13]
MGKDQMTKEVLTAILKSIDEGIHAVDTDGYTIFYNEVAARHDGLKISEVIGRPLLSVFPSLNERTSTLLKVAKTRQPIINQTQTYVNMYGKTIETVNTTLPILVDGRVIGAVEIAKDYSRMKLLSERLLHFQKSKQPESRQQESVKYTLNDLLTVNRDFLAMKEKARKLAQTDAPILVFGESGSGKELFVQGIHHASRRSQAPFVAQNCAAIPETLLESILFGTSKGSYTGAVDRPGLFELADGGTLFLDELHTMPIVLQAKLLRVLEEGAVRRVGSVKEIPVNTRVISAMNIDPRTALEQETLRPDLFYRLNVLTFELIPLRERPEDIDLLTTSFINSFNKSLNKKVTGLEGGLKEYFHAYSWPGNVRELKHAIEYMMNVCEEEVLSEADLPIILKQKKQQYMKKEQAQSLSLRENLKELEIKLIREALHISKGNIKQAALLLGIPRQTLQYKLQKNMPGAE